MLRVLNHEIDTTAFWEFVNERHRIFLRKQAGEPWPWTDDPVLQEGRFCNAFRELDTVTVWIRQHIREPFADHPNLWLMLAIARYNNLPATLQAVMDAGAWPTSDDWCPEGLTAAFEARKAWCDDNRQPFETGAYMIRAESSKAKPWYGWSKQRYVAEKVIGDLWRDRKRLGPFFEQPGLSLRDAWMRLNKFYGFGGDGFMAFEVVSDLRHTRYLRDAPDVMTWANAGPGARRGLNRMLGRDIEAKLPLDPVTLMRAILAEQDAKRGEHVPPMEMRDVEHAICETDKLLRVRSGEGKMRAKYRPGKAIY